MINLQKYYHKSIIRLEEERLKIKVGFTAGDMNGIGPEVLLNSVAEKHTLQRVVPIIYAPLKNLEQISNHLGLEMSFNSINSTEEAEENKINVIDNFKMAPKISFGKMDKKIGEVAFQSIKSSVLDLNEKKIDALVTAPINKEGIHSENFKFMGHTDYIDSKIDGNAIMMMVSKELKVALLTEHVPISKVTEQITRELVEEKILSINSTLIKDFNIRKPKIAILSIDPHAGDGGVIAKNDQSVIVPVVKKMNDLGIDLYGPFPSDSFFGSLEYKKYDIIVASFHDQGLIPFKTLSFGTGVNYSSGLERVRTSPDHGTAYAIAGKGQASNSSFLSSITLAVEVFKARKKIMKNNK